MKALLKLALFLAFCSPIFGQTSNVQATIVDGDGTPWVSGTYTITLIPSQAGTPTRIDNGQNVSPTVFTGTLDGTGSLSVTLVSASNINPKGSTWQFRICPNVFSGTCGTTNIPVNASGSYSSQLNAVITAPRISGGLGAYAYADVEVASTTNNSYWNVISSTCRYYGASWGACGTGAGAPPTGAAGGVLNGTYPNPGLVTPVAVNSTVSSATLGSELTTNGGFSGSLSGWTDSGSNWSYSSGALHTAGATDTLSQTITVVTGNTYQVQFAFTASAGSFGITIGDVPLYLDGSQTAFATTGSYNRSFVADSSGGALAFTPTSSFAGTVTSISVKQVTTGSATAAFQANNSDGSAGVPIYSGGIGLGNTFIGQAVGTSNTVGLQNVGVGGNAFSGNITGYSDVAVGYNAMLANTVGYQNTAVGGGAMQSSTSGSGNSAFGFFSLNANTLGFDNQAFGEFALQNTTTGQDNSAFGQAALQDNTTGNNNTAAGVDALLSNQTGGNNTAVGFGALQATTVSSNTAVGTNSLLADTTGSPNTAVGQAAATHITTGSNEVAIGQAALLAETTGNGNTAVGQGALTAQNGAINNVGIGLLALDADTSGQLNVAVGANAAIGNTTGSDNTYVGYESGYPSASFGNVSGGHNTYIGFQAGPGTSSQLTNVTCVGYLCSALASNEVVLGNSSVTQNLMYGNLVLNGTSSGSATLTVSSTGGTLTLPNLTQATTQSPGDNTTAVATDAFVLANATGSAALNSPNIFTQPQTAPAWLPTTKSAGGSQPFFDDYYALGTFSTGGAAIGSPAANSCTVATSSPDANHPGNLQVISGTVSGSGEYCGPASAISDLPGLNGATPWTWEAVVQVPVLPGTTAASYQAGPIHTVAASPAASSNGMFYLSSANGTPNDWYCGSGSASLTFVDSTVAAVAATWFRLTVISDGTQAHWYINGTQVCGTGTALSSSLAVPPAYFSSVTSTASTSVTLLVDYAYFYRALTR